MQHDDQAMQLRQPGDRFMKVEVKILSALRRIMRHRRFVYGDSGFDSLALSLPFAQEVIGPGGDYAAEPGAKGAPFFQFVDRLIGGDEGFLHRVLGIAPVLEDGEGDAVGSGCVSLHKLSESFPITCLGTANKGCFLFSEVLVQWICL
ncbi:MAG: hypothetical protein DDT30_01630 [Dehalococcoidia bacterium]|nr:hypothetical protein [Bacillota bacterium]